MPGEAANREAEARRQGPAIKRICSINVGALPPVLLAKGTTAKLMRQEVALDVSNDA